MFMEGDVPFFALQGASDFLKMCSNDPFGAPSPWRGFGPSHDNIFVNKPEMSGGLVIYHRSR
jgi:hypothetical protein